jgi:hypothetical protein
MSISSRIFDAISAGIKLNDTVKNLAEDVKDLAKEVKGIDRRLIRIETFVEIAEKQHQLSITDA